MLRRGFKSSCEEMAGFYRKRLELSSDAPLDPFNLASHLTVRVRTPKSFKALPPDVCHRLLTEHSDCWSAFTLSMGSRPMIVYNPTHSERRQSSDLMHELAHLILSHTPSRLFIGSLGLPLRSHDQEQEAEANWLCGCLLLPRIALTKIKRQRLSVEDATCLYRVSVEMLRYRMQVTGMNKIYG